MFAVVNKEGTPVIRGVSFREATSKKEEVDLGGYEDAPFVVIDEDNIPEWVLRIDEEGYWSRDETSPTPKG